MRLYLGSAVEGESVGVVASALGREPYAAVVGLFRRLVTSALKNVERVHVEGLAVIGDPAETGIERDLFPVLRTEAVEILRSYLMSVVLADFYPRDGAVIEAYPAGEERLAHRVEQDTRRFGVIGAEMTSVE